MSRYGVRLLLLFASLWGLTAHSSGGDIEVGAARARYDEQRLIADRAKSEYNAAVSRQKTYVAAYNAARKRQDAATARRDHIHQRIQQIDTRLAALNQRISNLQSQNRTLSDRQISLERDESRYRDEERNLQRQYDEKTREIQNIERRIQNAQGSGDWTCIYVDAGYEEHGGGHRATRASRADAEKAALAACNVTHPTCNQSRCEQSTPELENLRRQLSSARSEQSDVRNRLDRARSDLRRVQDALRQNRIEQENNATATSTAQNEVYNLGLERQTQLQSYSNAERDIQTAAADVARADTDVKVEQTRVDAALADSNRQEAEASKRYSYLQQVIANYETEKSEAVQLGSSTGSSHGGKEGRERSANVGNAVGSNDGEARGDSQGRADGLKRNNIEGYLTGRQTGASDALLAAAFSRGSAQGAKLAVEKAKSEKRPIGYNDRFQKVLNTPPTQAETVDITQSLPNNAGSEGVDLRGLHKTPVAVAEPAFAMPTPQVATVPQAAVQSPTVPAADNRFFSYPCDGLRTQEFIALCRQNYNSSYASGYRNAYVSGYNEGYRTAYNQAATPAYYVQFKLDVPAERERGRQLGAEHSGILAGFEARIGTANREEYANGSKDLNSDLGTGYLAVVKSVRISETSGDGLLQSGETLTLQVVIDNLAKLATPHEAIRARIVSSSNTQSVSVPLRLLPALKGETRTTLEGVITGVSGGLFAGDNVAVTVAVELEKSDGSFEVLLQSEAKQVTHFPVELVQITTDGALPVGKWTPASFEFKNLTSGPLEARKMRLSSKPQNVEVDNKDGIDIPALQPGESFTVSVPVMPTVWAGGAPIVFSAESLNAFGQSVSEQRFKKELAISRSASAVLLNAAGTPSDGSPTAVAAGSLGRFAVKLNFTSPTPRGPMVLRFVNASDARIKPADNTTISINYGTMNPGANFPPVNFALKIPLELKGQRIWAAVAVEEKGTPVHMLQVWMDVK